MRNTAKVEKEARRLEALLTALGRRQPLRDPIGSAMEDLPLTAPQLHAVMWLGREKSLTMGELAHRVGISEKTITGVVDRLERESYLLRDRTAEDRRVIRVHLTQAGLELFERIDAAVHVKICGFLSLLDAEDRKALFRIFEKVLARVEELPAVADHDSARKDHP